VAVISLKAGSVLAGFAFPRCREASEGGEKTKLEELVKEWAVPLTLDFDTVRWKHVSLSCSADVVN
jgi:hypothetical protein